MWRRLFLLIGGFLALSLHLADQSFSLFDYEYHVSVCVFRVGSRWHRDQRAPLTPPGQNRSDEGLRSDRHSRLWEQRQSEPELMNS